MSLAFLGQPLAGVGVLLGLAAATVNHRLFQVSTVRYSKDDGHMDRRPYVGTVAARLGGITIVAFALLFFVRPMGFGMVGGLVAFQVLLMANALGALWRYQRLQLAGLAPTHSAEPAAPKAAGRARSRDRGHQPTALPSRALAKGMQMLSAHLLAVPPIPVGDHVTRPSAASPSTSTRSGPR